MKKPNISSHTSSSAGVSWPGEPGAPGAPGASVLKVESLTSGYRTYLARSGAHLHSLSLNAETLPGWWLERKRRGFLSTERISELREIYDSRDLERSLILRRAEHLVNGKMPLLSHEPLEFSGADRWRRDHILGISAPSGSCSQINILDANLVGDIRRLWEPSRFGWAYWLGQAYVITGQIRFAEKFEELSLDWFAQNQFAEGVNYYSTQEIALRLYALIHALDLFSDYVTRQPELLSALLNGLWLHCGLVEKRLHQLGDSKASAIVPSFSLFAAGAFFPEFAEAYNWRLIGKEALARCMEEEFLSDGTHRSHSASGILYATDCYVQTLLIAEKTGFEIDESFSSHTRKIALRLAQLSPPDLILPQFNDCDGGSLCGFGLGPRDAAPALQAVAELFEDVVFPDGDRIGAGWALWMTGMTDESVFNAGEGLSRASVSTAIIDLSGADRQNKPGFICHKNAHGDYLLVRCQSIKQELSSAHDAPGGFTLYLNRRPVIVDNGTGSFTLATERKRFRSARGKNTLLVDGQGPSKQEGLFNWNDFCPVRLMSCKEFDGGFYVLLRSDGFSRVCGFSVETEREIIMLDEGLVMLVDSWTSAREIDASLELTVTPELQISRSGRMIFEEDGALFHYLISPQFAVLDDSDEANPEDGDNGENSTAEAERPAASDSPDMIRDIRFRPKIISRPFSPDYGIMGESPALVSEFRPSRSGTIVTIFSRIGPVKNTSDLARFRVGHENSERELLIGAAGKISLEGASHGPTRGQPVVFAR